MATAPITATASVPAENPLIKGVQTGIATTVTIAATTEGLSKISQLIVDIFALIEHTWIALGQGAATLGVFLNAVVDITGIINVLKRIRDWTCPDDDGKMLWEKGWKHIASMVSLTGFHLMSFVTILATSLKVIAINAALMPISAVRFTLLAGFSVFDFMKNVCKLNENKEELGKLVTAKAKWEQHLKEVDEGGSKVLADSWTNLVARQQKVWKTVESDADATTERKTLAVAKQKMWNGLAEVHDPAKIKEFCSKKIERLTDDIENHNKTTTKQWVNIAFDVVLVALAIFAVVASFVTPVGAALTALLIVAVITGVIDLTSSYVDELLKSKTLQPVEVPVA